MVPQKSDLGIPIRAAQPEIRSFFRFGPFWPAAPQNVLLTRPSGRYGVLDALWGLQSVCKPPNPGGDTPEKCPRNPDSGRPAPDTAVFPFRAVLARSGPKCALNVPRRPVRGARRTLGPPERVQTTKPRGWYPRKVPSESRFGPPSPRYGRFSGKMAKFPGLGPR